MFSPALHESLGDLADENFTEADLAERLAFSAKAWAASATTRSFFRQSLGGFGYDEGCRPICGATLQAVVSL